jgi:hypothetical protein
LLPENTVCALCLQIMSTPLLTMELVQGISELYYLQSTFCAFWKCCTLGH